VVLVVGGAGFIGSHLLKSLQAAGEPLLVFDNLERGHRAALRGARLVEGDLRRPGSIQEVFRNNEIEAVVHFAAYIEVGESVADPSKFYENNVIGTWHLLEAMREAGVSRLVFSSTAAVYGEPERTPIPEAHATAPTNPYGDSKLAVERMLRAYGDAYGLRSVALRYFNAAGADPEGEIGEDHRPETHLIPRILLSVLGKAEFKIFGDDYDTPDGTCIRDYVHVSDLASAHLAAIQYLRGGGASDVMNLGNGKGFSVREVMQTVRDVTGRKFDPPVVARREGDPARLVALSDKARQTLGWTPQFADLGTIVSHAWNWYQSHPEGYRD
jgi:UDP-glucose 4-epimerase